MLTIALDRLRYADHVRQGDVIGWPQGCGEPPALTQALVEQAGALRGCSLLFGMSASDTLQPALAQHFGLHALNGAGGSRRVTALADIHPAHVGSLPLLFRGGDIALDVMLVQVMRRPDGQYTLGVIADFTEAMIRRARAVIALLNPALPPLAGDAIVAAADIDVLVEQDERIFEMPDPTPSAIDLQVARHVAAVIPDRATVQLGIGSLPGAVAQSQRDHRDLGVHSGVVSDLLVDLVEQGVVTNAHKGRDAGLTVTGGLFGTRRLRDFAASSGLVALRNAETTHHVAVAAQLQRFHTINSAIEIDLTGQVNSEVAGGRYLGAVGGQVDFVRGGMASPGGQSILAFPSTTPDGKHSRIVATLQGPVTTARSDADVIVTEYGVARLRGCGLRERARRLLAIAHPEFRDTLKHAMEKTA
jgi:acetyl-CoA hydrolase